MNNENFVNKHHQKLKTCKNCFVSKYHNTNLLHPKTNKHKCRKKAYCNHIYLFLSYEVLYYVTLTQKIHNGSKKIIRIFPCLSLAVFFAV